MGHLVVNSDIRVQLITTTRDNLLSLIDHLPDLSASILEKILDSSSDYNYQEVLSLTPDNNKAKAGLTRIRNLIVDNAETAMESADLPMPRTGWCSWIASSRETPPKRNCAGKSAR